MNINRTFLVVVLGIVSICDLHAGLYVTLPKTVAKSLKSHPDIRVCEIDHLKEPKHNKNESGEEYQEKWDAFLETQRENGKRISDDQKEQLINILLNPENYSNASFSIEDPDRLAIDIKANGDSATLICGAALISTFHNGEKSSSELSDAGCYALCKGRLKSAAGGAE